MKSKSVIVTSTFHTSADEIWDKLQQLKTLQYITSPYATFSPVCDTEMTWKKGQVSKFILKLFGFIPMGVHTINVIQFDKSALQIYTNEGNNSVPVWNHKIVLKRIGENQTLYTDEVEISAGWKTAFVYIWSKAFYKHRQKKWSRLLRT